MRLLGAFFILVIFGAGFYYWLRQKPSAAPVEQKSDSILMSDVIRFKTKDNIEIVGDYYPAVSKKGVLLLHMMPADRKSWTAFVQKLRAAGFMVLAIDLRGHGESQGGPSGYKNFSDAEHRASRWDVEAGAEFLRDKGASKLHFVGASIGANLALEYLADNEDAKSAILLSPGLDYRGIKIESLMSRIRPEQGVYLAASDDDTYSLDTTQRLAEKISLDDRHVLRIFENSGHGTAILEKNPEFMDEAIEWLKKL